MGHFKSGALKAALLVKALICLATVEDALFTESAIPKSSSRPGKELMFFSKSGESTDLVASHFRSDVVKCVDDTQPEFLALLIFCNRNIFNVSHNSQIMDELALHHKCTGADDFAGLVDCS